MNQAIDISSVLSELQFCKDDLEKTAIKLRDIIDKISPKKSSYGGTYEVENGKPIVENFGFELWRENPFKPDGREKITDLDEGAVVCLREFYLNKANEIIEFVNSLRSSLVDSIKENNKTKMNDWGVYGQ